MIQFPVLYGKALVTTRKASTLTVKALLEIAWVFQSQEPVTKELQWKDPTTAQEEANSQHL